MSLAVIWGLRELRSGVKGFRIFLACLALGVAAIAAAGSTAEAFRKGLASQSREILGGDLSVTVQGRRFTPEETAALGKVGRPTDTVRVRAMAEAPSGARRLAEVRGVDAAYPLAGTVTVEGAASLAAALAGRNGVPGAAVEAALIDRLAMRLGDPLMIGDARFVVTAVLGSEPDRLSGGFALAPRVMVARSALEVAGLLQADSFFVDTVRLAIAPDADLLKAEAALKGSLPEEGGYRIRNRSQAAAGLRRLIDRLEYFLSFIGLASLVAGGLGVSGAVSTYLQARESSIAVLKALGADAKLVRSVFLVQIGALASLGVVLGLGIGAAAPMLLGRLVQDQLTVPALFAFYPGPLVRAAAFGVLAAAAFSLVPLARARATPPSVLFRKGHPGPLTWSLETVGAALAGLGLAGLALVSAPRLSVAAGMIAAVAVGFGLLWLLGRGAARLAGRLRVIAHGPARMGLANLAGPASAARTAAPAIGLGVALLAAIVLIQSSLLSQIRDVAPRSAPALVFTQIPSEQAFAFDAAVRAELGPLRPDIYRRNGVASGRIVRLKGHPVDIRKIDQSERWAFDRDITIAEIGPEPPDAELRSGRWWEAKATEPQVVLDAELAAAADLKVGDIITVQILGRDLDTRIAGLRDTEFGQFGTSYNVIINPAALAGANLRHLAIAKAAVAQERGLTARLGREFPMVNVLSVREQLEAATKLFSQLTWAVRGAAAVATLAGLLVLVGAIASTAAVRAREAAILKVLGANRYEILLAYALEYGAVGIIAAITGVLLALATTYPLITAVFDAVWSVDWRGLVAIIAAIAVLTAAGGAVAAFAALSRRPAATLRAD